ncbi:MAG: DbpA RNA binding domain-containing protein, partial [Gammaproteobacteria bacterium]|nr:DbpA RNA binding domain-containing protein [Gammaproteobacteria bacterium]
IEKATGQKIEQMQLPDREQISNHRVTQFKTQLTEALESQELAFFEEMIEGYQSEHNVGLAEVAAGLAYLLQKDRPLVPEFKDVKPGRVDDRDERPGRRESGRDSGRDQGRDRGGRDRDQGPMESYRLEVGRDHGVQPKNIVGAIANEAGIESRFIGGIKIHDDYSTVDLPANLPAEVITKLQKTWVCGQALRPSRINQGGGQPFRGKPKKFDGKKAGPRKPSDKKFADKGKPKLKIKPKEKKEN